MGKASKVVYSDPQEQALMRWEDVNVIFRDQSLVDIFTAKAIAKHVVELCQLPCNAPTVRLVEEGDEDLAFTEGAVAAMKRDGTMMIFYRPKVPTTVVLHEMAHFLVTDPLDALERRKPEEVEVHGSIWLSNYLWLLDKLMGPQYNTFYLRGTLPEYHKGLSLPFHPTIWGKPRVGL